MTNTKNNSAINRVSNLNLQLFAVQTTASVGLTPEMQIYYEKRLLDQAEPKLVHDQFADKYPIPKSNGKTIELRKYSPLPKAVTPLTEGVTPQGNSLNVTAVRATVEQYGDYIQMSDMFQLTAVDNNVVQATKLLANQAGRTLDTVTREVINAGTNVIYADKVSGGTATTVLSRGSLDTTATLTPELFFKAAAQLEAMNADTVDDSFVAIIHPYAAYDLMRSDEWIDVHKYAGTVNIYNGELGKIGNVRFVKSSEAKIWKNSTAVASGGDGCPTYTDGSTEKPLAVFSTLVLGAHAYATTSITGGGLQHIVKQLGYGEDPINQRSSCGWKAVKTAKILSQEFMVRIESCSNYSKVATAN